MAAPESASSPGHQSAQASTYISRTDIAARAQSVPSEEPHPFDFLPLPAPERLSEFLASPHPCMIYAPDWYALNFGSPVPRKDASGRVKLVVERYAPERAWTFSSAEDRSPEIVNEVRRTLGWAEDPYADTGRWEAVGFELAQFDDLGLLT